MNLWLLTSEFPPAASGGGIGTYCVEFGSALVRSGHQVTVFAAQFSEQVYDGNFEGKFPVVWVPATAKGTIESALGHWHRLAHKMAEAVVARLNAGAPPPDAIEVQDFGGLGYFLLKKKLLGEPTLSSIPIIVMCHTPSFEITPLNEEPTFRFPNYWIGRSEKFCLLAADGVLSPSQFLADRLSKTVSRHFDVCGLPIAFHELDKEPARTAADIDLLYVGRFELRKGVLPLLEGMKSLWDGGHRYRLKMIGGDTPWASQGTTVRQHIERKYHPYIQHGLLELSSGVPRNTLRDIQARAKYMVIPSIYENFPYTCIEGMARGVPILASASGGHAEMVGGDGECGLIFDWSRPGHFQETVITLMAKSADQRCAMGKFARKKIEAICNSDDFVDRRINLLSALVASHREQPTRLYPFLNQFVDDDRLAPPEATAPRDDERPGSLTVIVPYFNLGQFVRETISSIMRSDFPDIQVLIVDDGSTDKASISVLAEIEQETWRFPLTVLRLQNGGLANARNVGASMADTEFIAFLDADDAVESDYYGACMSVLQKYTNVSFVFSWLQYVGTNDGVWLNFDTEFPYFLCANMLAPMQVVRRSHFLEFGKNDSAMRYGMEDYEAWVRMAASGCLGVSLPRTLCRYRVRQDSMSRKWSNETVLLLREWMQKSNPKAFRRWGKDALILQDANGPGWLWDNPTRSYPKVGYVPIGQVQDRLSDLRWKFTSGNFNELVRLLDEPAVVWLIQSALRMRLHRLGVGIAKVLLRLRRIVPFRKSKGYENS